MSMDLSKVINICQLKEDEAIILVDMLKELDKNIETNVKKVIQITGFSYQEALEYLVSDSPILWAKVYLNWTARDYQEVILMEGKMSLDMVLRLGRRLGKTDCMSVLILWLTCTQPNKKAEGGETDAYEVGIFTPYETQIDLIFKRLGQLIDASPYLTSLVSRKIHHRYEFNNSAIIYGLTAGANSGTTGGNNTRGQKADVIIFDEVDYIGSSQITNIINIKNEEPFRIKVIAASTPSGKHEEFYKWCMGASKRYAPSQEDIDNLEFNGYQCIDLTTNTKEQGKGNGWTEIYSPSTVNKELLKINPITEQTFLEDLKMSLSEIRFDQEVMANFGDEEMGVYQKRFIQTAINEGARVSHRYLDINDDEAIREVVRHRGTTGPLIIGIDWDKVQSGCNFVCVQLDKTFINQYGYNEPKFKVLFRLEIPRSAFTYLNAVNKIIELNDLFSFDYVAIDRGYGEVQLEMLKDFGMKNPDSGLAEKTIGYQFAQNIEVRDPFTMLIDNKPFKPTMVNNSVLTFEREKIVLDPTDSLLREQIETYRVVSISSNGLPKYSSDNEHALDAMNLCLIAFEQKFGNLFKNVLGSKVIKLGNLDLAHHTDKRGYTSESENASDDYVEVDSAPLLILGAQPAGGNMRHSRNSWCETGYPSNTSRTSGFKRRGF